jgi:hypothetical protein
MNSLIAGKLAEAGAWQRANHDSMRAKIEGRASRRASQYHDRSRPRLEEGRPRRCGAAEIRRPIARSIQLRDAHLGSDRDVSRLELKSRAEEITDRILGSPDGRLAYEMHLGMADSGAARAGEAPRGPLAERKFAIPDARSRTISKRTSSAS